MTLGLLRCLQLAQHREEEAVHRRPRNLHRLPESPDSEPHTGRAGMHRSQQRSTMPRADRRVWGGWCGEAQCSPDGWVEGPHQHTRTACFRSRALLA